MVSALRTVGSATRDDEGGRTVKTMKRKTAPYGSWKSPITSDLIVAQSVGLSGVLFDGEAVYWLEARPQEQGRNVVVRAGASPDDTTDIVPKPFNVRTRAHEYGGGAWAIAGTGISIFRISPTAGSIASQPMGRIQSLLIRTARARTRLAVRRRHHRPAPAAMDWRARGSHR